MLEYESAQTILSTRSSPGVQKIKAGVEDNGLHVRNVTAQHCDWAWRSAWRHHTNVQLHGGRVQKMPGILERDIPWWLRKFAEIAEHEKRNVRG